MTGFCLIKKLFSTSSVVQIQIEMVEYDVIMGSQIPLVTLIPGRKLIVRSLMFVRPVVSGFVKVHVRIHAHTNQNRAF